MTAPATATSDWRHDALCRDEPQELFFPIGYVGQANEAQVAEAKSVCRRCPSSADCATWAIDNGMADGIWGGLTPDERRALRRRFAPTIRRGTVSKVYAGPTGRPPAPIPECGTPKAYARHKRYGEPFDDACRAANREDVAARRERSKAT